MCVFAVAVGRCPTSGVPLDDKVSGVRVRPVRSVLEISRPRRPSIPSIFYSGEIFLDTTLCMIAVCGGWSASEPERAFCGGYTLHPLLLATYCSTSRCKLAAASRANRPPDFGWWGVCASTRRLNYLTYHRQYFCSASNSVFPHFWVASLPATQTSNCAS